MRVGVKFCGGCNPRYDRSGELDKILANFDKDSADFDKDHIESGKALFGFAKDGGKYDVLLVICGCDSQCQTTDEYQFGHKITVGETGNVPLIVREIEKYREAERQSA